MVSVIIPAYNMEKYIGRCLSSVIAQTYSDLEIIVVDDGSSDNTYDIAKEYSEKDKRVFIYHKENGGVSSARNFGIEKATGEYIFFFDPDDLLEKDCIEVLVSAMEGSEADFVSCQHSRWDDTGAKLEDFNFITGDKIFASDNDRVDFFVRELLNYHVGFEVWNKLYRTGIIMDNDVRFSDTCKIGEDLSFNIKYMMHVSRMINLPDRCVRYTMRGDSAMGSLTSLSKKISEDVLLTKDIWDYIGRICNKTFLDLFPILFVKLIEHSYIGYSPDEVIDVIKEVPDLDFLKQRYKEIDSGKKEILASFPDEIAKIKYRYHLYVRAALLGEESLWEKLGFCLYDLYRRLRCRESLGSWKMPY